MVYFPPCKINLGLHVLSKNADGYHAIETCFYPVPWTDVLEVVPSGQFQFSSSGLFIPGEGKDNLCVRAYDLLQKDFNLPPVQFYLRKIIPPGAGLGGGSSDAAYSLKALNEIFLLNLSVEQLRIYASRLGSDCSFFMESSSKLGRGRGDILDAIRIDLHGKFLVLVVPDIHLSTAEAYRDVTPAKRKTNLAEILARPVYEWKDRLVNDFETSIFKKHPAIQEIKKSLYARGAVYSSLSGSGSSVFGVFDQPVDAKEYFSDWQYWSGELR